MNAQPLKIEVIYRSCDGCRTRKVFKTLAGARKFAQNYVGKNPDLGSSYAVSFDGIGTISATGCKLADLFGEDPAKAPPAKILAAGEYDPDEDSCGDLGMATYRLGDNGVYCFAGFENDELPF